MKNSLIRKNIFKWNPIVLLLASALIVLSCGQTGGGTDSQGQTLTTILDRGVLNCGVSAGLAGFSNPNTSGEWEGLDVDVCRATAAAVFGDDTKVNYVPLTAKERFTALQSGEIDVLVRNTTWTATRDSSLGLNFTGINYYDGQGFLVRKSLGAKVGKDLGGATVCIQAGTTTELNLADFFRNNKLSYSPVTFDTSQQTVEGFESARCDVLTSDRSQLVALRTTLVDPDSAVILDEVISKEPLGPVVRQGDDQWFNIIKWVLYVMIGAEEYGLNSQNADAMLTNPDAPSEVKRMLSVEGEIYKNLGLSEEWGYNVISQVGNYGESYDRNVGKDSPLQLARGVNNQWTEGGLLYAMPFR
ncbi:putative amino-acid ABC transporter-binding protein YhdW [Spirochaetota bacterium]|nr:putative amino-acid ABC transporter-binding protein YhdW [Spirochaetota bacterium]